MQDSARSENVPRSKSLAKAAAYTRYNALGYPRALWFFLWVGRKFGPVSQSNRSFIEPTVFLALSTVALFLPMHYPHFDFKGPDQANQFIGELWQVTAASIALTVALILFSFQIVSAIRASSLGDMTKGTGLRWVVYLGIGALLVQGLVLMGYGYGGPMGWAGTWSISVAFLSFLSIPYLFAKSLTAIEPRSLRRLRMRKLERHTQHMIIQDIECALASNLIQMHAKDHGYEVAEFGLSSAYSPDAIQAEKNGVVVDIRLNRLEKLARDAGKDAKIVVLASVGDRVKSEVVLLRAGSEGKKTLKRAKRIVVINHRSGEKDAGITEALDELHEEALQAIRNARPSVYDDVKGAYEKFLLDLPRDWARIGQRYSAHVAGGFKLFALTPLDKLARSLYVEVTVAANERQREILSSATYLPIHVAIESVGINAPGLSDKMLNLFTAIVAIEVPDSQQMSGDPIFSNMILHLFSYINYTVVPRVIGNRPDGDLNRNYIEFLEHGLDSATSILRDLVDKRRVDRFENVHRELKHVMEDWIAYHEHIGPPGNGTPPNNANSEIIAKTRSIHFAITAWIFHALKSSPGDSAIQKMFKVVASAYQNFDQVLNAAATVLTGRYDRHLSRWISSTFPIGQMHEIDTRGYVVDAVASLLLVVPNTTYMIEKSVWGQDNVDDIVRAAREVANDSSLMYGIESRLQPESAVDEVEEILLHAAVLRQEEKDSKLRKVEIDAELVHKFIDAVREGRDKARFAVDLMMFSEKYLETPDAAGEAAVLRPGLQSKEWFVRGSGIYGVDSIGKQYGSAIARAEDKRFWTALSEIKIVRDVDNVTQIKVQVEQVIADLHAQGKSPSWIFIGNIWNVSSIIDDQIDRGLYPDSVGRHIVGSFRRLPVVRIQGLPSSLIVVADLNKWASWHHVKYDDGSTLSVKVETFSPEAASAEIEQNPDLFSDLETDSLRANRLLMFVRLDIMERFNFVIREEGAAIRLRVKD